MLFFHCQVFSLPADMSFHMGRGHMRLAGPKGKGGCLQSPCRAMTEAEHDLVGIFPALL